MVRGARRSVLPYAAMSASAGVEPHRERQFDQRTGNRSAAAAAATTGRRYVLSASVRCVLATQVLGHPVVPAPRVVRGAGQQRQQVVGRHHAVARADDRQIDAARRHRHQHRLVVDQPGDVGALAGTRRRASQSRPAVNACAAKNAASCGLTCATCSSVSAAPAPARAEAIATSAENPELDAAGLVVGEPLGRAGLGDLLQVGRQRSSQPSADAAAGRRPSTTGDDITLVAVEIFAGGVAVQFQVPVGGETESRRTACPPRRRRPARRRPACRRSRAAQPRRRRLDLRQHGLLQIGELADKHPQRPVRTGRDALAAALDVPGSSSVHPPTTTTAATSAAAGTVLIACTAPR